MPRFWGGPADGEICDACDTRITKEQLVMEGIASTTRDLMIHLMVAAQRLIKVLLTVLFGRPRTPPWPWENPPGRRLAATSGRKHLRGFRLD